MGRTLQNAPESINIFTSFPPLHGGQDLVWVVIDLSFGAGYRENFHFTFIKVKLSH